MLSKVIVLYLCFLFQKDIVQGITWDVPLPLGVSICSDETSYKLYLNWTFTPATPSPPLIDWSLDDGSGTIKAIASLVDTTFTPATLYDGRVSRAGSTAEIVIQGPFTAADVGIYKVAVTPTTGSSLTADETVTQTNVTTNAIVGSSKENELFDFTVTCTLNSVSNLTLELWDEDGKSLGSAPASLSGITRIIPASSGKTLKCSVSGQGADCRTSNIRYFKVPVSSFLTTSIVVVSIMSIMLLVLVLVVLYLFYWINSVKLIAEDDLPLDNDLFKKLFSEHEMKPEPLISNQEADIEFKKSVAAKEITNKSVPDRRVKIVPKRDDNVRKFLRIAAIIFGFILVVITIIFIILKSVKCSGASSEGIFIAAVLISAIGLIFGLGVVVVVLLFLKMGGGTSQPKEEHRDCAKQPKKTPLHQSVRKHNVDNRLPPERQNTEDIKSTAVPLQLSKARSAKSPRPLPPRRLPPLNTTLVDTDTSTRKSKEETNEVSVQA